jgi:hypothetical protein
MARSGVSRLTTPTRDEKPPPRQHGILHCEARLRSLPNFDQHRCQPPEFICACGRRWVHVCNEAEGCSYVEAGAIRFVVLNDDSVLCEDCYEMLKTDVEIDPGKVPFGTTNQGTCGYCGACSA